MKAPLSSLSRSIRDRMSTAPIMVSSAYDPSQLQQPQQPSVTNSSASPYPSTSSSSSLTNLSPGIIITLLILSVTIILTTSLCLLFRHFHRLPNFLSRRRHSSDSSSDSSSRHLSHRPSATPTPAAANQSLIDSLPLFSFSSVTRRKNTAAATTTTTSSSAVVDADCSVCLSKFVSHDTLRLLPLCCHAFHSQCIDTWLSSGHDTCPLCRSNVYASLAVPAELILRPPASTVSPNGSFRLEIGSVSRHRNDSASDGRRSYSIGSFDYVVEADSEVAVADRHRRSISDKGDSVNTTTTEITELNSDVSNMISGATTGVGGSRSWLEEYMDRLSATLSSRTLSFRSSRRFFTGSSRRSDFAGVGEWDIEASRVGEEISELFSWASGV